MPPALKAAFAIYSPRVTPRRVPLASRAFHGALIVAFVVLVSCAFWADGAAAWAAGFFYIGYDVALLLLVVALVRSKDTAAAAEATVRTRPTIAIIIAAHNEAAVLPATLAALERQLDWPDVVMIADDGSRDATAEWLRNTYGVVTGDTDYGVATRGALPNLWHLPLRHAGKAAALNQALLLCDSDVIVTLDADTQLDDNAIAEIRAAFIADPDIVAAGGVIAPICERQDGGRVMEFFQSYEYLRNIVQRFAWSRCNGMVLISGAFAAFRRDALLQIGGFDAQSIVEDYDVVHRLQRCVGENDLRWHFRMIDAATATTHAPSRLEPFLRQRLRWFSGFLQTHRFNRDMVFDRRFGAAGMLMLPIKALDTLQPLYGLASLALLAVLLLRREFGAFEIALCAIAAKIVFDIAVYAWAIKMYQHRTGRTAPAFAGAVLAAAIEPFTFQPLRQCGAALGWLAYMRGIRGWGRSAEIAARERQSPAE